MKRAAPLVVNDRALGREAGYAQALLDNLKWLLGDEVEREPFAALPIGSYGGVVKPKLPPAAVSSIQCPDRERASGSKPNAS